MPRRPGDQTVDAESPVPDTSNSSFRLRLQLCVCETLMMIALGVSMVTGFKHWVPWLVALSFLVLASLGARSLRERAKSLPPLQKRERTILFGCYSAPYVLMVLASVATLIYFHAEFGIWTLCIFPALLVLSWVLVLYNRICQRPSGI